MRKGQAIIKALTSNDLAFRKTAEEDQNKILQTHVRGDSIVDRCIPPIDIGEDDLDVQVDSVKPIRYKEMDSYSPGAMSMAFGGASVNYYMHIPRYIITYTRLASMRMIADVNDLLTYRGDITSLYHDKLIKDLIDQKDRAFLLPIRTACGDLNDTSTTRATKTGAVGYTEVGSPSRTAARAAGKALADTKNNLDPATILINNSTKWDFMDMDHDAIGGPKAEKIFFEGFQEDQVAGLQLMTTSKNRLIPNNDGYVFTDADLLGDNEILQPTTFVNRSEAWYLDTQAYTEVGGAFPNLAAFARFSLTGSFSGWLNSNHAAAS